jgi:hypothetical protein
LAASGAGSVAEIGQQVPVVVIRDADRLVLIDGYLWGRGAAPAASRHGDRDDVASQRSAASHRSRTA